MSKKEKKEAYIDKLSALINKYNTYIFINADNVGAKQLNSVRRDLRELNCEIMMGKNSLIKRAFRQCAEKRDELKPVEKIIKQNVGIVFCAGDVGKAIELMESNTVPAEAKRGTNAPCDVWLEKGLTGLEPTKTSFFQTLEISTKITKGQVDILVRKKLLNKGDVVGSSEANMLHMLGYKPFHYGLSVQKIFQEGTIFDPDVLKLSDDDLIAKFAEGIRNVAALSMEMGYLNEVSLPHVVSNSFKDVLAVAVGLDFKYTFEEAKDIEEYFKDPSKFVKEAPKEEEKKEEVEEKKEEEDEESDADMGLGLFGGGGDSDDDD